MALKIRKLQKKEAVYDITVKDNHNFFANGVVVHNCQEIAIPTKPCGTKKRKFIKVKKSELNHIIKELKEEGTELVNIYTQ